MIQKMLKNFIIFCKNKVKQQEIGTTIFVSIPFFFWYTKKNKFNIN